MGFLMGFEVSTLRELFPTFLASVGFLPCVTTEMNLKGTGPHESLLAKVALEGSLPRVPPHMICQMTLSGEVLVAAVFLASKGLFP